MLTCGTVRVGECSVVLTGVQMSQHHAAWLATVAGAKLWHLAPPDAPKPSDRYCPNRGKIDYALAKQEGVVHCMAQVSLSNPPAISCMQVLCMSLPHCTAWRRLATS